MFVRTEKRAKERKQPDSNRTIKLAALRGKCSYLLQWNDQNQIFFTVKLVGTVWIRKTN